MNNYRINGDVLITDLGEEGVAFNSLTNEYFSLNETSFKILKGIERNLSIGEICEDLTKEFAISASDCEKEVHNTVKLFLTKKLVIAE